MRKKSGGEICKWFFKISQIAQVLLSTAISLNWPDALQQRTRNTCRISLELRADLHFHIMFERNFAVENKKYQKDVVTDAFSVASFHDAWGCSYFLSVGNIDDNYWRRRICRNIFITFDHWVVHVMNTIWKCFFSDFFFWKFVACMIFSLISVDKSANIL